VQDDDKYVYIYFFYSHLNFKLKHFYILLDNLKNYFGFILFE